MPTGSVRSLIALALTGAVIYSILAGVPSEYIAILMGPYGFVVKSYFDARKDQAERSDESEMDLV
jgi:hypothetical protein